MEDIDQPLDCSNFGILLGRCCWGSGCVPWLLLVSASQTVRNEQFFFPFDSSLLLIFVKRNKNEL